MKEDSTESFENCIVGVKFVYVLFLTHLTSHIKRKLFLHFFTSSLVGKTPRKRENTIPEIL
jgi:hypothetical protein